MSKVLVIEKKQHTLLVMTDDAQFLEIPLPQVDCEVGQEIEWNMATTAQTDADAPRSAAGRSELGNTQLGRTHWKKWSYFVGAAVAAILFFVLWFNPTNQPLQPQVYAYITFDINPSVELAIDEDENVLDVRALNADAEPIVDNLEYEDASLDVVLEQMLTEVQSRGYLVGDNRDIVISTTITDETRQDESEELNKKLETNVSEQVKQLTPENDGEPAPEIAVTTITATPKLHEEAEKNEISTGKYILYLKAKEKETELEVEDVKQKSVNSIKDTWELEIDDEMVDDEVAVDEDAVVPQDDIESDEYTDDSKSDDNESDDSDSKIAAKRQAEQMKKAAEAAREAAKRQAERAKEAAKATKEANEVEDDAEDEHDRLEDERERAKKAAEDAKELAEKAAERAAKAATEQAKKAAEAERERLEDEREQAEEAEKKAAEKQKEAAKKAAEARQAAEDEQERQEAELEKAAEAAEAAEAAKKAAEAAKEAEKKAAEKQKEAEKKAAEKQKEAAKKAAEKQKELEKEKFKKQDEQDEEDD